MGLFYFIKEGAAYHCVDSLQREIVIRETTTQALA